MPTLEARVTALERTADPQQQVTVILLVGLQPGDTPDVPITRIRSAAGGWCLDLEAGEAEDDFRARAGAAARARGPGVHLLIGERAATG